MSIAAREKVWSRWHWLAIGCCLVVFGFTALIADVVFEHVAHLEDEVAYFFQAQVFSTGRAYVSSPEQPNCFFAPFVVDHEGRRFGKYPPGWPALLAVGVLLGQPWWVNSCCAALAVALVFRLSSDLHGAACGALAAGLAVLSPFLLLLSASLMSHASCLVFVTAFLWLYQRLCERERLRWALAAGVSLGIAFLIRPFTAAAIAGPAMIDLAWRAVKQKDWRRGWFLALGFVPLAVLLPVTHAVWTGDPLLSPYVLFWPYDRLGFGPGHGTLPGGNTLWLGLGSALISLGNLASHLLGWPACSLVFVALLFAYRPVKFWDLFLLATAVSLILGYVLYWTNGDVFGPRYIYESSSALFVLSAAGMVRVGQSMTLRGRRVLVAAVGLLVTLNLTAYLPRQLNRYHGLYGITAEPVRILESVPMHQALVVVRDQGGWKDYAGAFALNRPGLDGDVVYASECPELIEPLLASFPGRSVYYFDGHEIYPWSERPVPEAE